MKIAIIGESATAPTGFGGQTRLICEELGRRGHEVTLLAGRLSTCSNIPAPPIDWRNGVQEVRFQDMMQLELLDQELHRLTPDVVLAFGHTAYLAHLTKLRSAPRNVPLLFWLPYEGSSLPFDLPKDFRGCPSYSLIHLSEFARKLWEPHLSPSPVVPHAVDLDVWQRLPNFDAEAKKKLRRKYSKRFKFPIFDDAYVVLNTDRNIWHKRWDATFDYVRRLRDRLGWEVVLIANCLKVQDGSTGHPVGYDLPYLEKVYGIEGQVCYTDFEWHEALTQEELVEVAHLCDIRISTSEGEGFGCPTIEMAAAEVLQVVNMHTTIPELLGPANSMMVAPAMTEERHGTTWQVPHVEAMVGVTQYFDNHPEDAKRNIANAKVAAGRFSIENVGHLMEEAMGQARSHYENGDALKYQWGYLHQADSRKMFGDLARACKTFTDGKSILEVGSGDGAFIEICTELGLTVRGIEHDLTVARKASARAAAYMELKEFNEDWPLTDILVMTDMPDVFFEEGGSELVQELYKRVRYFKWAFLRHHPRYTWGIPSVNPDTCRRNLIQLGLTRNQDLEESIKSTFPYFDHEVWIRSGE